MLHLVGLLYGREIMRELLEQRAVAVRTPGLIRGEQVELACPSCFASATVEVGAPARILHIGNCTGTLFVRAVGIRRTS